MVGLKPGHILIAEYAAVNVHGANHEAETVADIVRIVGAVVLLFRIEIGVDFVIEYEVSRKFGISNVFVC